MGLDWKKKEKFYSEKEEAMAMGGDQERIDSEGSPKVLKRV